MDTEEEIFIFNGGNNNQQANFVNDGTWFQMMGNKGSFLKITHYVILK